MSDLHEEEAAPHCIVEPVERRTYGRLGTTLAPGAMPPRREVVRRPAIVAARLAQALGWHAAVEAGQYPSFAALARAEGIAPQRVAQILALTMLAPDIQEQVLFLESEDGTEPISERALREVAEVPSWSAQRARWEAVKGRLRTTAC